LTSFNSVWVCDSVHFHEHSHIQAICFGDSKKGVTKLHDVTNRRNINSRRCKKVVSVASIVVGGGVSTPRCAKNSESKPLTIVTARSDFRKFPARNMLTDIRREISKLAVIVLAATSSVSI